jgi:hypothetical protein
MSLPPSVPRGAIGALLALGVLSGACSGPKDMPVPAQPGGRCRVTLGDPRSHVLVRCGKPCAEGTVPDGECPESKNKNADGSCENHCDIYQDVEVCYAGAGADQKVVSMGMLDREFGRFKWCFWPGPPIPGMKKQSPQRAK